MCAGLSLNQDPVTLREGNTAHGVVWVRIVRSLSTLKVYLMTHERRLRIFAETDVAVTRGT